MTKLFLYEYASAQPAAHVPPSVRREGRAMFEALCEDARALPGIELLTLEPGSAEPERFRDLARQADLALIVVPEFDSILESRCRWVEEAGCRLLGPSSEGIRRTADKWLLYQHWKERGVPTPETWLPPDLAKTDPSPPAPLLKGEMGKRYLKKHRYGAGSLDVGFVANFKSVGADAILQRWVPGSAASVGLILGADGAVLPLLPCRQLISDDGSFTYLGGELPLPAPWAARLVALARKAVEGLMGRTLLVGYVGIDAILGEAADGSQDVVLEINPRVTTSYIGLRRATFANLLDVMWRAVDGRDVPEIVWDRLPVTFSADGER